MTQVLVVEDDALTARMVCDVVAAIGYDAVSAATVLEAKAQLTPATAALLVDLHLGADSGIDLIVAIENDERFAGIPVVAMTGEDAPDAMAELDRFGVVAVLRKPFATEELVTLVQAVIETGPKNKRPPDGGP